MQRRAFFIAQPLNQKSITDQVLLSKRPCLPFELSSYCRGLPRSDSNGKSSNGKSRIADLANRPDGAPRINFILQRASKRTNAPQSFGRSGKSSRMDDGTRAQPPICICNSALVAKQTNRFVTSARKSPSGPSPPAGIVVQSG